MPKFMTYQRPTPVNKTSWNGKPGAKPYQPARKPGAARPAHEPQKPALPIMRNGIKSH